MQLPAQSFAVSHPATHTHFNYYGRWHIDDMATTINSGSLLEFAYRGNSCVLCFDVEGFSYYPAIFVQVDNGPVLRTSLSCDVSKVAVTPLYNAPPDGQPPSAVVASRYHLVRAWIATHSLYLTSVSGTQWNTLEGGCRFIGAHLQGGDLLPLPYHPAQIEFLGDSITQGLRLLFTGADDDTGQQIPYANWPQYTADLLGMKPVVTGFGGQGLTTSGTCGAPPAHLALPLIHGGARWEPPVEPRLVVIYQGTNDGATPQVFESCYTAYLSAVRGAYAQTVIFAVCPHLKANYAAAIEHAVNSSHDKKILFLDYSSGVIAAEDTCDGCHLNPGGAVALAARLARDIGAHPAYRQ